MKNPLITIVSRPRLDNDAILNHLKLLGLAWKRTDSATEAEEIIELAGRVCYLSFGSNQSPRNNREYITHLIEQGHESVLEHASWTFLITGVSRSFSHQLVRHRVGFSYSQLSQQYHNESDALFVKPHLFPEGDELVQIWEEATNESRKLYADLLSKLEVAVPFHFKSNRERLRAIKSIARSILPTSTETKIAVTANARALRHFLRVRGELEGDYEMRIVSGLLLELLKVEAPSVFYDFTTEMHSDGFPITRKCSSS